MTGQMQDPFVLSARAFALAAHSAIDQKRKYTFEPYIVHPAAVVATLNKRVELRQIWQQREMLAAAWLHDVVEDTKISADLITQEFGDEVGKLVWWLTDPSKGSSKKRAERKAADREHLSNAPYIAKTIKLADLIDNTPSIVANDPDFARIYLKEKRALLEVLQDADQTLFAMADTLVHQGMENLDC